MKWMSSNRTKHIVINSSITSLTKITNNIFMSCCHDVETHVMTSRKAWAYFQSKRKIRFCIQKPLVSKAICNFSGWFFRLPVR